MATRDGVVYVLDFWSNAGLLKQLAAIGLPLLLQQLYE